VVYSYKEHTSEAGSERTGVDRGSPSGGYRESGIYRKQSARHSSLLVHFDVET